MAVVRSTEPEWVVTMVSSPTTGPMTSAPASSYKAAVTVVGMTVVAGWRRRQRRMVTRTWAVVMMVGRAVGFVVRHALIFVLVLLGRRCHVEADKVVLETVMMRCLAEWLGSCVMPVPMLAAVTVMVARTALLEPAIMLMSWAAVPVHPLAWDMAVARHERRRRRAMRMRVRSELEKVARRTTRRASRIRGRPTRSITLP